MVNNPWQGGPGGACASAVGFPGFVWVFAAPLSQRFCVGQVKGRVSVVAPQGHKVCARGPNPPGMGVRCCPHTHLCRGQGFAVDVAQKADFLSREQNWAFGLGRAPVLVLLFRIPGLAGDAGSQGCSRRGGQGAEERFQAVTDSSEHEPSFRNSHGKICRNRKLSVKINMELSVGINVESSVGINMDPLVRTGNYL